LAKRGIVCGKKKHGLVFGDRKKKKKKKEKSRPFGGKKCG